MGALSWWHWAIVLVVLVVLFGSKKLPEAARGLGRSMRIFKSEMSEMANDGKDEKKAADDAEDEKASTIDSPRELTAGGSDTGESGSGESGANVDVNVSDRSVDRKKSA
ncbi:Sec-independent protein translocase subunit TatA [Gordonia zhaorongruii]|uniref:Sec-independent protein translocase subunit TatA n=1 Tax=Gordonia zhaorongruii TaxID=2597659 RepID=UPI001F3CDB58|nr:Sec-independent protein translocase subunit TatA [Gordonia zhaorongruii]